MIQCFVCVCVSVRRAYTRAKRTHMAKQNRPGVRSAQIRPARARARAYYCHSCDPQKIVQSHGSHSAFCLCGRIARIECVAVVVLVIFSGFVVSVVRQSRQFLRHIPYEYKCAQALQCCYSFVCFYKQHYSRTLFRMVRDILKFPLLRTNERTNTFNMRSTYLGDDDKRCETVVWPRSSRANVRQVRKYWQ